MMFSIVAIGLLIGLASASGGPVPIGYSVRSDVDDHLYSIDLNTGVATDLGLVGCNDVQGLAFVGSTLYGMGGTVDEFWDITTPPGSKIGDTGSRSGIDAGLDYNPITGKMYNIQRAHTYCDLYEVNLATGAATLIGSHSGDMPDGLAIDNTGAAYAIDGVYGKLYTLNLATGALTLVGPSSVPFSECGASFDSGGTLWGIFDNGEIYTVDTGTGASTLISSVTLAGTPISGFEGLAILMCIPHVIPDVPLGTVMAGVAMIFAFIAYAGTRRTHVFRRP